MSAGWLTLSKMDKSLSFIIICLNVYCKTLSKDALWLRHHNSPFLCLNLSWPLGYEHNDQTLDTNGWNDCPLQCVCSSFTQGQSSSRGSEGQRCFTQHKGAFRGLLCILLWFLGGNCEPLSCEQSIILELNRVPKAPKQCERYWSMLPMQILTKTSRIQTYLYIKFQLVSRY